MATINENTTICPVCGGTLENYKYGQKKCAYCEHIFSIEFKDISLLDKAKALREKQCFEEALDIYRNILKDDSKNIEANYGALLSEFGVEYIEDNKYEIPTIHRPVFYSIKENEFSKQLLSITFGKERENYLVKISELEELRLKIIENLNNAKKYDIFISCKITENGDNCKKTEEYQKAETIYKKLCAKGLSVFFSPYSLPSTNGEYEPIIYSALQSCKYFILVASSLDNINSKWIKNEWGRFLELRKNNPQDKRYYKLVINESSVKAPPAELFAVNYIDYNRRNWLFELETAVHEIFPEYGESQYKNFNPVLDYVDLSLVKKQQNKKIQSKKITHEYNALPIVLKNPYIIHYHELESDYSIDDNVKACVELVGIQLQNGHFSDAKLELNKYLNFIDDRKSLEYDILILQLLINTESRTLEEFFEEKLDDYSDFELIEKIINKLPKNKTSEIICPLSFYILTSIKNVNVQNAFELYKIIYRIQLDEINELNYKIARSLPFLYEVPKNLMEFADLCFPYVASSDLQRYIEMASELVNGLCKNSLFEQANQILQSVLSTNTNSSFVLMLKLMVEKQSVSLEDLLLKIEETNTYFEIEDLVTKLHEEEANKLVSIIKNRINVLISEKIFDSAVCWVSLISSMEFEDRISYFKMIMVNCKSIPESVNVFIEAMNTLNEDDREFLIKTTYELISKLICYEYFDDAKKLCAIILEYDCENNGLYNLYLLAEIKSKDYTYNNIYLLQDMSIIEKMLIYQGTNDGKQDLIARLMNSCIIALDNKLFKDNNVFEVFDKLISYCPDIENNSQIINKILNFAERCLSAKLFDKAKWYYIMLIRIDQSCHQAYWGIICSKLECSNDEELISSPTKLNSLSDYSLAIMYSKGNKKAQNRYEEILHQQLQTKNKKKNKRIIITAISAGIIVLLIVISQLI